MFFPTVIIKDVPMNGKPNPPAKMPPRANDNKYSKIKESHQQVMSRLTRDIAQSLLREQDERMMTLVKCTNIYPEDIVYCNVRAAGRLFLASLEMINCTRTRRQIIEEFDMISNNFLK